MRKTDLHCAWRETADLIRTDLSWTRHMDIYLPADFHLLHDDAVADWRDLSTQRSRPADTRAASSETPRAIECSVDPTWLAI